MHKTAGGVLLYFLITMLFGLGMAWVGEQVGRSNGQYEHDIQFEGCRYWNVLTPDTERGDTFWIGGWTKDCGDGILHPVIEFGPEEDAVEVLSRMENFIALRETEWAAAQQRIRELESSAIRPDDRP